MEPSGRGPTDRSYTCSFLIDSKVSISWDIGNDSLSNPTLVDYLEESEETDPFLFDP